MNWRIFSVTSFVMLAVAELAVVRTARAGCTAPGDLTLFRKSVARDLGCSSLALGNGAPPACARIAPPACAGEAAALARELALGGAPIATAIDVVATRRQLRCQRALLRAASQYVGARPAELVKGSRGSRAGRVLSRIIGACAGVTVQDTPAGTRLPSLGGVCASAIASSGTALDASRAGRCLRAALEGVAQQVASVSVKPNFVFVMTDDQNLPSLQQMSRVLEHVGSRGVTFANAFVSDPVCAPSRASILTARYPHRHGLVSNYQAAANFGATPTVANWLGDAGYRTGLIGKYLNMAFELGSTVPAGWDEWYALLEEGTAQQGDGFYGYAINDNGVLIQHGDRAQEYSTDVLADRVVDFLRVGAKRPFFLLFTPYAPHGPSTPAPRHEFAFFGIEPWRPPNWREADVETKPTWVRFMKSVAQPVPPIDELRRKQLASLQAVDEAVARISDTLEALGLTDNTVLIFTSDHGFHWGEHWWPDKFSEYEESLRVPLLVRYPLLSPEPSERGEMVLNFDLTATIAELAGAQAPSDIDGQSMIGLLQGDGGGRDEIFIRSWGAIIVPPWLGVRTTRWKYVDLETDKGIGEELYDLEQDPYELTNLALLPAYGDMLVALRERAGELGAP